MTSKLLHLTKLRESLPSRPVITLVLRHQTALRDSRLALEHGQTATLESSETESLPASPVVSIAQSRFSFG